MKRKGLIIPLIVLAFILIFTLMPVSLMSADTVNLVKNGDFSDGLDHWSITDPAIIYDPYVSGEVVKFIPLTGSDEAYISQEIDTSKKNLTLSFDVYLVSRVSGFIFIQFELSTGDDARYEYGLGTGGWNRGMNFKISDCYADSNSGDPLPNFDSIVVLVGVSGDTEAWFDNIKLTYPEEKEVEVWVRTQEMTCKQVWVNEDNKFQFSFIYPYRDNNWVKIYDMSGKEVFSIDMPYDNPNIIVDLPDGMYTVKTFNVDPATPIQTFVIGKP